MRNSVLSLGERSRYCQSQRIFCHSASSTIRFRVQARDLAFSASSSSSPAPTNHRVRAGQSRSARQSAPLGKNRLCLELLANGRSSTHHGRQLKLGPVPKVAWPSGYAYRVGFRCQSSKGTQSAPTPVIDSPSSQTDWCSSCSGLTIASQLCGAAVELSLCSGRRIANLAK